MIPPEIDQPLPKILLSLRFRDYKALILRLFDRFNRHNTTLTGAGVAFYLLLSLFPALAALVSIFGLVSDPDIIAEQIQALQGTVPDSVTQILGRQAISLASQASGALGWGAILGLVISVWSANKGTKAFIQAMNVINETYESRRFLWLTAQSLLITFISLMVGITMLVAIVVVPPLLNALITNKIWDTIAFVAKWPFMVVIMSLCFSYLYRYAPSIKDPGRKAVLPGAVLATAGWFVISLGFSIYADNFSNYNETYGALAGVAIFFVWLLLSSVAVLMGAELNLALWHVLAEREARRHPPAEPEEVTEPEDVPAGDTGV